MAEKPPRIELNEQFRQALDLMEHTPRSVFVTGRAGTGKSTLLRQAANSSAAPAISRETPARVAGSVEAIATVTL